MTQSYRTGVSRNNPGPSLRALDPTTTNLLDLVDDFCDRYPNDETRRQYRRWLHELHRDTGRRHPTDLTEADLIHWCTTSAVTGRALANNTVHQRRSLVRTFLRWCLRCGHVDADASAHLNDGPLRSFQRTYGRVQATNPGRWLTYEQAFSTLVAACQDGTQIGLRDELVVRLGLAGVRAGEIGRMTIGNLRLDHGDPHIAWSGKGHKPRRIDVGPALAALLHKYLAQYTLSLGHTPTHDHPLICRNRFQGARWNAAAVEWGTGYARSSANDGPRNIVVKRAAQAGLGHVATHDLRRTAAGILHRSTDEHGAHHFDLLDIQRVLDHSDPSVTMRCYLDPMDHGAKARAASVLD